MDNEDLKIPLLIKERNSENYNSNNSPNTTKHLIIISFATTAVFTLILGYTNITKIN